MSVSLNAFRNYVNSGQGRSHDQVHFRQGEELTSVGNAVGAKIQRLFRSVSREGARQARENQHVRNELINALRADLGEKLPDSVVALLKKYGFDLSLEGRQHSTKSLSTRAIRSILAAADDVKAHSRQVMQDKLWGARVEDLPLADGKESCRTLVDMTKDSLGTDRMKVLGDFVDKMFASEASSTKTTRLVSALTVGLKRAAEAYREMEPEPKVPSEPRNPSKGFLSLFSNPTLSEIEEFKAKKAAYDVAFQRHESWKARERVVFDAVFERLQPLMQKLVEDQSVGGKDYNAVMDGLLNQIHDDVEGVRSGLFDGTVGKVLEEFDARMLANGGEQNAENAGMRKSNSANPVGTFGVRLGAVAETVKKDILGLVSEKLSDYVESVDGFSLEEGSDGVLLLSGRDIKIAKDVAIYGGETVGYLSVPVSFSVDSETGKLRLDVKHLMSDNVVVALGLSACLRTDANQAEATKELTEKLGASSHVLSGKNDSPFGKLKGLSSENIAPIGIREAEEENIYSIEIDPAKFGPLKALGLDQDTRFRAVSVKDGFLSVRVGGEADGIDAGPIGGTSDAEASVNLGGVADRVKHMMSSRGVKMDSLTIVTDPQRGLVTVDVRKFDATGALKDMKGLKGVAARKFANGSFRISFKPSVDPLTGEISLRFDSVSGGLKGKLVNKYLPQILHSVLDETKGIEVRHGAPEQGVATLRVSLPYILPTVSLPSSDVRVRPAAMRVTAGGLTLGVNFIRHDRQDSDEHSTL